MWLDDHQQRFTVDYAKQKRLTPLQNFACKPLRHEVLAPKCIAVASPKQVKNPPEQSISKKFYIMHFHFFRVDDIQHFFIKILVLAARFIMTQNSFFIWPLVLEKQRISLYTLLWSEALARATIIIIIYQDDERIFARALFCWALLQPTCVTQSI